MNKRKIYIYYSVFSLGLIIFGLLRNLWAFPDVTWQTNYLFLDEVIYFLEGQWNKINWYHVGSGHALTGYKYFLFLNAYFFNLNTHVELWIYWILIFSLTQLFGVILIKKIPNWNLNKIFFLFIIALLLSSFHGAGSRGMELSTYLGTVLLFFTIFFYCHTRIKYKFILILLIPLITFFLLGGYIFAFFSAIALVVIISLIKSKLSLNEIEISYIKLFVALLLSLIIFFLMLNLYEDASPAKGGIDTLIQKIKLDYLFPIKFFFFGLSSSLITSLTFENITIEQLFRIWISVSSIVTIYLLLVISIILKKTWSKNLIYFQSALIFYGFGTIALLLITRPFDVAWALSPWYAFHFKIFLVGCIGTVIVYFDELSKRYIYLLNISTLLLVLILAFSNKKSFERHPHERNYFKNIINVTLNPELLNCNSNNYSQMIVPCDQSLYIINTLKRYKLGVYKNKNDYKR
jgi:hypothetical protein